MRTFPVHKPLGGTYKYKDPLMQFIHNCIFIQGRDCLVVVTGRRGTGKSLSVGCKVLSVFDKTFNAETLGQRCVFKPMKFIELLDGKLLKRGNGVLFDEAGVGMYNREWYTQSNKEIIKIIQTSRYKGLLYIFTLPNMDYLDSQAKKMFDVVIRTEKLSKSEKRVYAKVQMYEYDDKLKKEYYKYFRVRGKKIKRMIFTLPEKSLIKEYERIAKAYKDEVIAQARAKLTPPKPEHEKRDDILMKAAKNIYTKVSEYKKENGKWDRGLVVRHIRSKGLRGTDSTNMVMSLLRKWDRDTKVKKRDTHMEDPSSSIDNRHGGKKV